MDDRLERILNAGVETTTLPSGLQLRGVRPSVEDLIQRRALPADLRQALADAADHVEDDDHDAAQENAAIGLEYLELRAAAFAREYRFADAEAWLPITITIEQLRRMSEEDRDHLRAFTQRRAEVAAFEPFRDVDRGADPRPHGEDVAHDPKPVAANPRRRRGVRAG